MSKILIDEATVKQVIAAIKKCHYYMIDAGLPNQSMLVEAYGAYSALESALIEQPAPVQIDVHFLRQTLAVAIGGLCEHYKDDVLRVFTLDELQAVVDLSDPLRHQQAEDIYKRAWDMLAEQRANTGTWVGAGDLEDSNSYLDTTPPPQRMPLTHEQRFDLLTKFEPHKNKWEAPAILIDMVEAAHGIKENT